jgi:anaerobic selenocysteine-containing dehydrogenase
VKRRFSLANLLRAEEGPYSDELALTPGPHGALPARLHPDSIATMTCGFCSTGCGLDVHLKDGRAINLAPSAGYPVNDGAACPKGWDALAPLASRDRALRPMVKNARGALVATDWNSALDRMVSGFRAIERAHGPAANAFLSSGQIVSEEMALLGAVAKLGMGMVHGDGNTRQCMATAVVAYKESFGFDAPPYTYRDLEESDVIVLWGSNLAIAHPILWQRVQKNRHDPRIIVVDPRATETAQAGTWHVALKPKSDLALAYGVCRELIARGWIDRAYVDAHTEGYGELAAHVAAFTPERVAADTTLPADTTLRLAEAIHAGKRVSLWWTMGVNQSHQGVRTAQALIAIALLTGNLGRPGTGANSITGQCNAMGSRLWSNTTNLYGGRDFTSAGDRAHVAGVLGIDEARIPRQNSLSYDRILEGVVKGTIRGLWVIGTNPAHSWINQPGLDEVLSRLELLVVQDMYATTETARRADVLLPAAGWGEKQGTFINSERRVGLVQPVSPPPGEALSDFSIFRLVAERWGVGDLFRGWSTPAEVFEHLKRLSVGTPCDISGITGYAMLAERGGVQWPYPAGGPAENDARERRLFADGRFFTPTGKARFKVADPEPLPESPSRRYPFLLNTGRGGAAQWHTQTRTGKSAVLRKLAPTEVWAEIHPDDARRVGVRHGDRVKVTSRRGHLLARAVVTPRVRIGEVFVPMHDAATNQLTVAAFDPYSRQPAYKAAAVGLEIPEAWEVQ